MVVHVSANELAEVKELSKKGEDAELTTLLERLMGRRVSRICWTHGVRGQQMVNEFWRLVARGHIATTT